jgi:hypothetical protein
LNSSNGLTKQASRANQPTAIPHDFRPTPFEIDRARPKLEFPELRDLTARMSGYYREQDWTQALGTIELCRKAAERFGISALYDTYSERIEAFRRDPPPPDWDGVYEAESK